jgi:hypothetical protein
MTPEINAHFNHLDGPEVLPSIGRMRSRPQPLAANNQVSAPILEPFATQLEKDPKFSNSYLTLVVRCA